MYCKTVTAPLFQWAGKAASIAVHRALDEEISWSQVEAHGVYLAIADVVMQL